MPSLVRRELDLMFQSEFHDVEQRIRPRIEQVILGLQPRLLRLYQESLSTGERASDQERQELHRDANLHRQDLSGVLEDPTADVSPRDQYSFLDDVDRDWPLGQSTPETTGDFDLQSCNIDFEKLLDPILFNIETGCVEHWGPPTGRAATP